MTKMKLMATVLMIIGDCKIRILKTQIEGKRFLTVSDKLHPKLFNHNVAVSTRQSRQIL